jgi:hypothetical protein
MRKSVTQASCLETETLEIDWQVAEEFRALPIPRAVTGPHHLPVIARPTLAAVPGGHDVPICV